MNELLIKFVELCLLSERIRSKNFNFDEFKKLNTTDRMRNYAQKYLTRVGFGTGRTVYALSSKKALKIGIGVIDDAVEGALQNKREFEAWEKTKSSVLPKVFEHDQQFRWLTSELMRPVKSTKEFSEKIGTKFDFDTVTAVFYREQHIPLQNFEPKAREFIEEVQRVLATTNNNRVELQLRSQWGVSTDGKIKLLDAGR